MNYENSEAALAGAASGNSIAHSLGQRQDSSQRWPLRSTLPFVQYIASRFAGPEDVLAEFLPEAAEAAAQVGATIVGPLVLDGGRHYLCNLNRKNDKRQSYIGRYEQATDGTVWPCITFFSFKAGVHSVYFNPRNAAWEQFRAARFATPTSALERRAEYERKSVERMQRQAAIEAERRANAEKAAAEAAKIARHIWNAAQACSEHNYLTDKRVRSFGLRVASSDLQARVWLSQRDRWETCIVAKQGDLLVPLYDIDGKLWNVQRIEASARDGKFSRRFLPGSRKHGLFFRIGAEGPAWIAEGYATAATVHAATGAPVIVGLDAHNMAEVVKRLRGQVVAVAADNDASGVGANGATATGLPCRMPPTVGHDWNDHARTFGLASAGELLGSINA